MKAPLVCAWLVKWRYTKYPAFYKNCKNRARNARVIIKTKWHVFLRFTVYMFQSNTAIMDLMHSHFHVIVCLHVCCLYGPHFSLPLCLPTDVISTHNAITQVQNAIMHLMDNDMHKAITQVQNAITHRCIMKSLRCKMHSHNEATGRIRDCLKHRWCYRADWTMQDKHGHPNS